ncbi:MAG: zinc-binding dehydrogenase [Planctomycetota bacterium]|nr:zinc-binding dehydrogenase [Planctomycetota bacterium]
MTRTLALRLYGKNDLRLEAFDLPPIADDEILADITSDSVCMSSYKATIQGEEHKRVPNDVATHPIIIGHEFCGTLLQVGKKWAGQFKAGQKYSVQPAMSIPGRELEAPGYSFPYIGGDATKIIIPREVMEADCLLAYEGPGFFPASLSEPVSCIIGAFNTNYHYTLGEYTHKAGIVAGGAMAILAGAGPMGLGAVDYAIHGPRRPRLLVVTDIDQGRLDRAAALVRVADAQANGVDLRYVNTGSGDAVAALKALTGGAGFDDVFVFAPVAGLIEQGSALLGFNGCLNFFAGPAKADFKATINFYDVHYMGHHIVGSSGGNTQDMRDALVLMAGNQIDPAVMITHVGGLDSAAETIKTLPKIPGGKRLVYTGISMPMTALTDLADLGAANPMYKQLAALVAKHNGLWSVEAEAYLLGHAPKIEKP